MTDNALKIIEALGIKKDEEAIDVLRDLGTNSPIEEVREKTAVALIKHNCEKSMRVLVANEGKGINDLNTKVALSTVGKLVELKDKTSLMKVLDETIENESSDEVKTTARSLRALITLSE